MDKSAIRVIVEDSSTIWERLNGPFVPIEDGHERAEFLLRKWIQSLPSGSFEKRLALKNLTLDQIKPALFPARLPADYPLPEWTQTLEELINAAKYVAAASSEIPFSEILYPAVELAFDQLESAAGNAMELLSNDARNQMKKHLMSALSDLFMPAIASELNLARNLKRLKGDTAVQRYHYYLQTALGSPQSLLRFFSSYPVLARLSALLIIQWIESIAEFLFRLQNDVHEIANIFNEGKSVGMVGRLNESISDRHNGWRNVKEIQFESGLKVLYKAKDLGIDVIFINMLQWLNEQDLSPGLRTFRLLHKEKYGWTEFVESPECKNPQEIKTYYRRTGILLGVLHALGASDSHMENVIACGDSPVLVDMETLLRAPVRIADSNQTENAAQQALRLHQDSVLSTGLLPEWRFGGLSRAGVDVSGISGAGDQQSPFFKNYWSEFNSDSIRADLKHPVTRRMNNQPLLSGKQVQARDYVEEIARGFEQAYRFILKERTRFGGGRFFSELSAQKLRYLNRATKEYAMILERSLDVDSLRDGAERSIRIDLLCRSLLNYDRDHLWPLLSQEQAALERMDIPYMSARANSTTLLAEQSEEVHDFFEKSAAQVLLERFDRLNTQDMERQLALLRASFEVRYRAGPGRDKKLQDWLNEAPLSHEALIGEAVEIGDRLIRNAIRSSDQTATWIGIEYFPVAEQYQLQPLSIGLYDGLSGVALFLSALDSVVPGAGYGDHARMAMNTLRLQRATTYMRQTGAGGLSGVASIAYSLAWSSRLLNDNSWMDEAMEWSGLLTRDAIESAASLDFLSGIAGAIPVLLRLYEWNGNENLLTRAIDCGKRLLSTAGKSQERGGFAHGPPGIAYTLFLLGRFAKIPEFVSAGAEMLKDGLTLPSNHNRSWCKGAPGIAACVIPFSDSRFDSLIERGIRSAKEEHLQDVDHLCCGNAGRVDILLTAARHFSSAELFDAAARQMAATIGRAKKQGAFQLFKDDDSVVFMPGLFQGLSGIGYTCLRLADDANRLPSLLLME